MHNAVKMMRSTTTLRVIIAFAIAIALTLVAVSCMNSLKRTCFISGWVLFAVLAVSFLRRFFRVKSAAPPEQWVAPQTIFAAIIISLFFMHIEFQRPNGWLDTVLTGLFALVLITSTIGALLWIQLRAGTISCTGDSDLEKLASESNDLQDRAAVCIHELADEDFVYTRRAVTASFARAPIAWRRALWNTDLQRALRALQTHHPTSSGTQRRTLDSLTQLVIEKDRLDALRAGNSAVRRWLLVHMPAVACLLALGTMHAILAHAHGLLAHVMLGK
jgi:heme/copper-type cytochrome/quinol oxidase subunit 4